MDLPFIGTKCLAHQIGILDSHIQQRAFASRFIVGDRSLVEVPAVIQLMAVDFLPSVCSPPSGQAGALVGDASGQIAIRLLRLGNDMNHAVKVMIQFFIIMRSQ